MKGKMSFKIYFTTSKAFPLHATMETREIWRITSLSLLNLETRWRWVLSFMHWPVWPTFLTQKEPLVPTQWPNISADLFEKSSVSPVIEVRKWVSKWIKQSAENSTSSFLGAMVPKSASLGTSTSISSCTARVIKFSRFHQEPAFVSTATTRSGAIPEVFFGQQHTNSVG
jgi:hypothetical protein